MNKLYLSFFAIMIAVFFAGAADAKKYDLYLSLKANYSIADVDYHDYGTGISDSFNGFGGRLAFGERYRWWRWLHLRGESELSYVALSHDGYRIPMFGFGANIYADFGTEDWLINAYVGAGFGIHFFGINGVGSPDHSGAGINFPLQIGILYDVSENWKLDVGLRYAKIGGWFSEDTDIKETSILAGFRWHF
ncbi:MAG: porin family protein [Alphaproteobacteria bacterium]|nr:porin family protein [Alphaproteobacteria bacterium]